MAAAVLMINGRNPENAFEALRQSVQSARAALKRYERHARHDPKRLQHAQDAVAFLERRIASRTADARVVKGADSSTVVSPEDGFYGPQAEATATAIEKMFELHRRALDALHRMPDARLNTDLAKADAFTKGTQESLKLLRGLHSIFVQGPKLVENLEKAHAQGTLTEIGTVAELFSEATKAIRDLGESVTGLIELMARSHLPKVAQAAKGYGREFSRLTVAFTVVQIAGNVLKLIDAVENGDEAGIGQSVHGILQGMWTLAAWALRIGTGATAMVSFVIYLGAAPFRRRASHRTEMAFGPRRESLV
jgi:hypothetical protein